MLHIDNRLILGVPSQDILVMRNNECECCNTRRELSTITEELTKMCCYNDYYILNQSYPIMINVKVDASLLTATPMYLQNT